MVTQLAQSSVMKAAEGCLFDGAIHPFHLPAGPWMEGACQAMLAAYFDCLR